MIKTLPVCWCLIALFTTITFGQEADYHKRLKIKNPAGREVFSVKFYEDKIKVEIPGLTLGAPVKTGDGKRKYQADGKLRAEIKYGKDGFKLRTPDGKLLWKVKLRDDNIEIANNEEMTSPWRITGSGKKLKVSHDGKVIGEVKWYPENGKLKLKSIDGSELFEAKTNGISAAIGLLRCDKINPIYQAIIMVELEATRK